MASSCVDCNVIVIFLLVLCVQPLALSHKHAVPMKAEYKVKIIALSVTR